MRRTKMLDVTHVSVFLNCDEVLRLPATDPYGTQKLKDTVTIPVPRDAHVVVAFGKDRAPHTSAVTAIPRSASSFALGSFALTGTAAALT